MGLLVRNGISYGSNNSDTQNKSIEITGILPAGETTITLNSSEIKDDVIIDTEFCTSVYGVCPTNVEAGVGYFTLTFEPQETDLYVKAKLWVSMDESYTELTGILVAGETELVLTDVSLNEDSTVAFSTSVYGVAPTNAVVGTGTITMTFAARDEDLNVKVRCW